MPFYCVGCGRNYCSKEWGTHILFDEGFYDCTEGICQNSRQHGK
jgi:hypothetical protein